MWGSRPGCRVVGVESAVSGERSALAAQDLQRGLVGVERQCVFHWLPPYEALSWSVVDLLYNGIELGLSQIGQQIIGQEQE